MKKPFLKVCTALAVALMASFAVSAAEPESAGRHEVRLGIGDMMFETLIWHDNEHKPYSGIEDTDFVHTPHFSAEYSYNLLKRLSIGLIFDFQYTGWNRSVYKRYTLTSSSRENFYNIALLPTLRFNYFRRPHVGLYSAISAGMDINGGSEKDGFGRNTVCCFAADVRLLGLRAGGGNWWGFVEFGALAAMQNSNIIYMMGSELIRAGLSCKF